MSIRDELAQVIAVALAETNPSGLGAFDELSPNRQKQLLSRGGHAADAILARFGVVELPAPEKDDWGNPDFSNEHIRLTVYSDGRTQLEVPEYFGATAGVHPFQLRDLAARCLAAANRAEAQS